MNKGQSLIGLCPFFKKKRKRGCADARVSGMRKRRYLLDGALYHVTMRANRKEMIFTEDSIKGLYMEVLKQARKRYLFAIENFMIMGNHVHLMIRPGPGENLSRIMQWINSVFAMRYNRAFCLTGHTWGERFFSCIINRFQEYIRTFEYIENNPVRAQLVQNVIEWKYSGARSSRDGNFEVLLPPNLVIIVWFPYWQQLAIPALTVS